MKLKLLILVALGLVLTTGIYASAKSFGFTRMNTTMQNYNQTYNQTPVNSQEQFLKKVELTFTYLNDYDLLSTEEKQLAITSYQDALTTYMEEVMGYNQPYSQFHMPYTRYNQDAIISKQVELTNKYFTNYTNFTDAELQQAITSFGTELRASYPFSGNGGCHQGGQYFNNEQHTLLFDKRIELTLLHLSNYNNLTVEEKQLALANYESDLSAYMTEQGYTNVRGQFFNMHPYATTEERDLIISKHVELTIKYFSDYANLTDIEKAEANQLFHQEVRDFMHSQSQMMPYNHIRSGRHHGMGRRSY